MKFILLTITIIVLSNCSKPKTVLICGDHVCINKAEANQYFQENLSIEVKVIDKKDKNDIDLVELNLKENSNGKKKISILPKKNTKKDLKVLSNDEINKIKKNIKDKKKEKKIVKKVIIKKQENFDKKNKVENLKDKLSDDNVRQTHKKVVDVCSLLEKCNIEEISKYLLKQGKKKEFPDITKRR